MKTEEIVCPECGNIEFKKEYKSELNVETYCSRCGLILKKDVLADEYDDSNWAERGFRPNSWDICYTNHITDYFTVLPEVPNTEDDYNYSQYEADDYDNNYTPDYQREMNETLISNNNIPVHIPSYDEYLGVNLFKDSIESRLKYLRRYKPSEFNKYHKPVIIKPASRDIKRPKYNWEKNGGE